MRFWKGIWTSIVAGMILTSAAMAEEYSLQYFLAKASSENHELSKEEKDALLNRVEGVLDQVQRAHRRMVQTILSGEMDIRYQEGRYWMSKLGGDQTSIDAGLEQLRALKGKPTLVAPSIVLYKSLKDLSLNFNGYNNMPAFSGLVGDLAPEVELWADPVFYKLYLLPLAELKDKEPREPETQPAPSEKKTNSKTKTPPKGSRK
jgi:hypothetical protein